MRELIYHPHPLLLLLVADGMYPYPSADTDRDGWIQINYDQFMKVCVAPPTHLQRIFVSDSIQLFRWYSALPESAF